MLNRPNANPEMIDSIDTNVQTPELRSLLLQIVFDQCVTQESRTRLTAYLTGERPRRIQSRIKA